MHNYCVCVARCMHVYAHAMNHLDSKARFSILGDPVQWAAQHAHYVGYDHMSKVVH